MPVWSPQPSTDSLRISELDRIYAVANSVRDAVKDLLRIRTLDGVFRVHMAALRKYCRRFANASEAQLDVDAR